MHSLIDFSALTKDEREDLFTLASSIKARPGDYNGALHGKIMGTLFYEPSTRTRLSFETAMLRLGGGTIGFADPNASSVSKGESLRDTVKIVAGYADITVIRSPVEGAAFAASLYSDAPVINAGDGAHLHPTQTMMDIFTIRERFGKVDGLTIGICGDLKNGRTVHSLIRALSEYENVRYVLISTPELSVPQYILDCIAGRDVRFASSLEESIGELDVLYMTRIQRERFASEEQYEKEAHVYVLDRAKLDRAKDSMIILHPLPKVDEISPEVDDDPRALYFEQAKNGLYVRMALVMRLVQAGRAPVGRYECGERYCPNPRCVTNHERALPVLVENGVCRYCDTKV